MNRLFSERRIVSTLILVLSFGLIASTFGLGFADLGGAFSPMFFPRIILTILTTLAALNVLVELITNNDGKPINLWPVIIIGISFLFYVLALVHAGYFISSVVLGFIILVALGIRNPFVLVFVPVVSAGSLVALFNHVLKMPLPSSPFVWWL